LSELRRAKSASALISPPAEPAQQLASLDKAADVEDWRALVATMLLELGV
jgi:hypothetical protein